MARKPKELPPEIKALMDQVAALPNLDGLLDQKSYNQSDREAVISHMRLQRALVEAKEKIKEDKKAEA